MELMFMYMYKTKLRDCVVGVHASLIYRSTIGYINFETQGTIAGTQTV